MDEHDDDWKSDESRTRALARRDLMKRGAGVIVGAMSGSAAAAQGRGSRGGEGQRPAPATGSTRAPGVPRPHTGPGYKNTANRLGGNGSMDDTTRKIVKFVSQFNESKLTEPVVRAINRTMLDSLASAIAGFE